jgi:hypothetical protein
VELFLKKDESAIIHTAEKYGCRLRSISQRITADILTAEECENDTYLEAWNRIPPNEPRTYLIAFLSKKLLFLDVHDYNNLHVPLHSSWSINILQTICSSHISRVTRVSLRLVPFLSGVILKLANGLDREG